MLCILTSKRMLAHAFSWSKTMKNIQKSWKSTFSIMCTKGSWRKTKKKVCWSAIGSDSQNWLTHKRWLLIWNFVILLLSRLKWIIIQKWTIYTLKTINDRVWSRIGKKINELSENYRNKSTWQEIHRFLIEFNSEIKLLNWIAFQ